MLSKETKKHPKPVVLLILDGYGVAPPNKGNAISLAKTPNMDHFISSYPAMTLTAAGEGVGLRWGEMGSSQVGHLNIGAGRVFYQALMRITSSIENKTFFKNKTLLSAFEYAKKNKRAVHLLGLMSNAGVHSVLTHFEAIVEMARREKIESVYIHAFLDGRDSPYNSGKKILSDVTGFLEKKHIGEIATLSGRFYAMDRDNQWDRIEKTYQALVFGKGEKIFEDPTEALQYYYDQKIFDEMIPPVVIAKDGEPRGKIQDGDVLIFWNIRADRAREITKALVLPGFEKFERNYLQNLLVTTLTQYDPYLPVKVAFPEETITHSLAEVISSAGFKQLHIGETEKYAHVTYFLNGGQEKEFPGEKHILVPSKGATSYASCPEMSASLITEEVVRAVQQKTYDFIAVNFANADMVGHTGDLKATIKAVQVLDTCLGKIAKAVLEKDGVMVITADHGNAEEVIKLQTHTIDKEHSTSPVPFLVIGNDWLGKRAGAPESFGRDLSVTPPCGLLSDVAPTILFLMGIKQPKEMTGNILIHKEK